MLLVEIKALVTTHIFYNQCVYELIVTYVVKLYPDSSPFKSQKVKNVKSIQIEV